MEKRSYTVQVHLIEARGLVARRGKESTDSFCVVSVAGRKKQTEIQRNTVNCIWDEVFIFENIMLTADEFERENIYVQVFEANTFWRNELIGQYTFGFAKVNRQKEHRHQFFRTWVVLTDPNNPAEEQGFVRCTATVLGPGDKPPSHESTLVQRDDEEGELILRPPTVRRRGYNLNIKLYRAEGLPDMDPVSGSADPFVSIKFNGMVVRSNVVRRDANPVWNQHLWLPVFTPCMSDNIDVQLWDRQRGNPDELIATHRVTFSSLLSSSFGPAWINMYGTPVDNSGSRVWAWIKELVRRGDVEQTAFLGRLLLAMNAQMVDEPAMGDRSCPPAKEPRTQEYLLRMDLYAGSELSVGFKGKVMVEMCWGPDRNTVQSDWAEFNEDSRRWEFSCGVVDERAPHGGKPTTAGECQFRDVVDQLPRMKKTAEEVELAQLYDIVINVYAQSFLGASVDLIGYLKIKPRDVWGWRHKPEWHQLRGLMERNGKVARHAGFLLFSLEFGPLNRTPKPPMPRPRMGRLKSKPYEVRVYLYQARHLLPVDEATASANARVMVSIGGETATRAYNDGKLQVGQLGSSTIDGTLNPMWYEILRIPEVALDEELALAPPISLKVIHTPKTGLVKSEKVIGRLEFRSMYATPDAWPAGRGPKWLQLSPETGDTSEDVGHILVRFEVVPKAEARSFKVEDHRFTGLQAARVSLAVVGLRNLAPVSMLGGAVTKPVLVLEVPQVDLSLLGLADESEGEESEEEEGLTRPRITSVTWRSSDAENGVDVERFSGAAPNLLQTVEMDVRLPVLASHCPSMTVRVFESGTLSDTLVGYREVPLRQYCEALYGRQAEGEEVVAEMPVFHHELLGLADES
eukprot:CAMPEP_0196772422 /NCGR_PEP_ID=MMETSP1104-20130614/2224_1 /TAXON_ID=33652 /ORGANISM="Cafeteria sp., Strain Caron Lab Isolate" /LENGTH=856 /DNA_ID=CAMNT_0042142557 /DNA_START=126 /DNA_END=2693 /DNA_ORIENTATION=+